MNIDDLPPKFREQARVQLGHASFAPHSAGALLPMREVKKLRKAKPDCDFTKAIQSQKVGAFFAAAGIMEPVTEYRFDAVRRWRFDYAWPEQKIALEVEGGIWTNGRHTRGAGFLKDCEKYNRAGVLGWRVFRVQPSDLLTAKTTEMIRGAMKLAA